MAITAAIGFTAININEQRMRERRVTDAQKRERAVASAERANQARRSRREQIREARIRQAEIENIAATSGQTGSSAAIVAGDSLQARLGTNIGDINTALAFGGAKSQAAQDVLEAGRKSGIEILTGAGLSIAGISASSGGGSSGTT